MNAAPSEVDKSSQKPAVLVVEDDVLVRLPVSEYLRECGFQVIEVGSAAQAQTILNSCHVDVVFSDVQLPGVSGFTLARWIREHFPGVTIILTSGAARMASDAADLCEHADFLPKPYPLPELSQRIRLRLAKRDQANDT